jgi:glycosyltransferase involved in cell wall biosynthesis
MTRKSGLLWIDVTELFDQFRFVRHPTGIGRVIVHLADALRADPGDIFEGARILFWDPVGRCALTTEDPRLRLLSSFLPQLMASYADAGLHQIASSSRAMKAFRTSLPRRWRYRIFPSDNGVTMFTRLAAQQGIRPSKVCFSPGDCLFVPGSFWLGKYAPVIAARANAAGVPVTAFVHDLVLLSHPEWLPGPHSEQFRRGCDAFLPSCAAIICNSLHTQDELRRLVSLSASLRVAICRLGDQPFRERSLPIPTSISTLLGRRYVLFVSTITPRKNHKFLVEAWRRLWRDLGPLTPNLLLVGGGAPDAVLSDMLDNERAEGGRIIRLAGVDDSGLEALYEHAWMTIYPSLAEGYGIPVAEALSHGKICLAAPSGGIQEISDDLIDFIDPLDPESVVKKVKAYLSDPALLSNREAEIKKNYQPTDWAETARTVRFVLEETVMRFQDANADMPPARACT